MHFLLEFTGVKSLRARLPKCDHSGCEGTGLVVVETKRKMSVLGVGGVVNAPRL